jgi:hypothetical protein
MDIITYPPTGGRVRTNEWLAYRPSDREWGMGKTEQDAIGCLIARDINNAPEWLGRNQPMPPKENNES